MIIKIILSFLLPNLLFSSDIPFGHPHGPSIQGVDNVMNTILSDDYNLEILMSFANHKKGAAGHLALSVRKPQSHIETVYSANFYADRQAEHDQGYYTEELIMAIPKKEYLYGVQSSVSKHAKFGLDFGELFKRSVIGIRVYGLNDAQITGIEEFYQRINQDYKNRASNTEYQRGEVVYDYMNLNCAKSVAQALKYGAGLHEIAVRGNHILGNMPYAKALFAHTPTETTMQILKVLHKFGAHFDVILYKRSEDSTYQNDDPPMAFKELANRFPSVKSLDFFNGSTAYEDYDNLLAMNLFFQMGKYSFEIPKGSQRVVLEKQKSPIPYDVAMDIAKEAASEDSKNALRRMVRLLGLKLTADNDNSDLYDPAVANNRAELFELLYSETL
ncbi:MAG: hypothetical protein H3C47_03035 [Candidatus Cloacimonetes bacterium]|nr:hypothetical protein [Candidatus Cloacimonadota bacterium]